MIVEYILGTDMKTFVEAHWLLCDVTICISYNICSSYDLVREKYEVL